VLFLSWIHSEPWANYERERERSKIELAASNQSDAKVTTCKEMFIAHYDHFTFK